MKTIKNHNESSKSLSIQVRWDIFIQLMIQNELNNTQRSAKRPLLSVGNKMMVAVYNAFSNYHKRSTKVGRSSGWNQVDGTRWMEPPVHSIDRPLAENMTKMRQWPSHRSADSTEFCSIQLTQSLFTRTLKPSLSWPNVVTEVATKSQTVCGR